MPDCPNTSLSIGDIMAGLAIATFLAAMWGIMFFEDIEVMLVVMDPRGDAMALCGLPDEF